MPWKVMLPVVPGIDFWELTTRIGNCRRSYHLTVGRSNQPPSQWLFGVSRRTCRTRKHVGSGFAASREEAKRAALALAFGDDPLTPTAHTLARIEASKLLKDVRARPGVTAPVSGTRKV